MKTTDSGSSRVYKGYIDEKIGAVKQLKLHSLQYAGALIAAHESLFELSLANIIQVLRVCPKQGQVILEYCEKNIDGKTGIRSIMVPHAVLLIPLRAEKCILVVQQHL